jgi:spore coat protein U-like protein
MMRACALAALMLVFLPAIAHAALGTCQLIPTDMNFGTFSGAQITATGSVQITCSNGSGNNTLQVGLTYGNTSSTFPNSTANRLMQSGNNRLPYQVYTSSARTTIWGDGTGGTTPQSIPINYPVGNPPVTTTLTAYGVLFAGTLPPPAGYTDALTVTVPNTTTAIHVSATVAATCSITTNNLNFGVYSGVQLDGTTTVSATCTSNTPFNIGLNQGVAAGATVTTRKMTGPAALLAGSDLDVSPGARRRSLADFRSHFLIGLDPGLAPGDTRSSITAAAAQLLSYSLFRDSGRTLNWGNTVGTDTVASTGTGSAQTFTVYGRIPASQAVGPGTYQDTITVTVTF